MRFFMKHLKSTLSTTFLTLLAVSISSVMQAREAAS